MEESFIYFLYNLKWIVLFLIAYVFVVGLIKKLLTNYRNKTGKKTLLNKKELIIAEIIKNIPLIAIIVGFLITGIFLIFVIRNKATNIGNNITVLIFGIICIIIPLSLFYKHLRYIIKIINGNYVVIKDILKDKETYTYTTGASSDETTHNNYRFYFNDYFHKYNQNVSIQSSSLYKDSKIDDEFYLIFVKGEKEPSVHNLKRFEISEEIEEKIISIDDLGEFINSKEFDINNENIIEKKDITKEQFIKEFYNKEEKRTLSIDIIIAIILIMLLVGVLINSKESEVLAITFLGLFACFFIFMAVLKIKYLVSVISDIKHDRYKIKEDEVISVNDKLDFKDTNNVMKFKLKKYKKILYADRKEFNNTQLGDTFYLIYVKSEKEPIKFYNKKNVNIKM